MAKVKLSTKVGELKYVFIKGEGRNQEIDPTATPNMCFTANVVFPKDSEQHKHILEGLNRAWEEYKKEEPKAKGTLKSSSLKDEYIKDPKGEIDPETDEVRRIPTGNVIVSAYTKTTWADGKSKIVKLFDGKGNDITVGYANVDWSIGEGSTGVLHTIAVGNTGGGNAKITLYLNAVQLGKLVKYEGDSIETATDLGEEIDMGDAVSALPTDDSSDNKPDID